MLLLPRQTYLLCARFDPVAVQLTGDVWSHGLSKRFALVVPDVEKTDLINGLLSAFVKCHEDHPVALDDTQDIQWTRAHTYAWKHVDPFAKPDPSTLRVFELHHETRYELSFVVRRYAASTRGAIEQALTGMGWDVELLARSQRNLRFPNAPTVALDVACAVGRWTRGDSATTAADPFLFQQVGEIVEGAAEVEPAKNVVR